jgi:hypothetical protein
MVGDPTAVAAMKRLKSLSRELLHTGEGRQEESDGGDIVLSDASFTAARFMHPPTREAAPTCSPGRR